MIHLLLIALETICTHAGPPDTFSVKEPAEPVKYPMFAQLCGRIRLPRPLCVDN
jgi:hypothetical protein